MDKLYKHKLHNNYILAIIYTFFALILGFALNDGLILFMGWNMVLATLPFLCSEVLVHSYQKQYHKSILFILLFLFIIFWPNAMYMMTDLIHFQNYAFFIEYPDIYNFNLVQWIVFAHILIGALLAAKIAIDSICNLSKTAVSISKQMKLMSLNLLFILSSMAIYIGRFLRYNSWEIYKIFNIIKDIFSNFSFFIGFVLLMWGIQMTIYLLFKPKNI